MNLDLEVNRMSWIVLGEEKGKVKLVSKSIVPGLLPKGSYLTVEQEDSKFILRVDGSVQSQPYSPTPMIADMDLKSLIQDQKCQNIILATRIRDLTNRTDGLIEYIKPQSVARRANQDEIDLAISTSADGPRIFPATVYGSENQILTDDDGNYISVSIPQDMFFHQILICGKTGTGKTVGTKYLSQYFTEVMGGCVLAINVKEADFLRMDQASVTIKNFVLREWESLGQIPHGIESFTIYYPASTNIVRFRNVNRDLSVPITLNVREIDPEALIGLLYGISDKASQSLPNIFRFWQFRKSQQQNQRDFTFNSFMNFFNSIEDRDFETMNTRGDQSRIKLHPGTFNNIQRNLDSASIFFDNEDAETIDETDILIAGKMSVIDVSSRNGIQFGSILLRDLLTKIVDAKSRRDYDIPVLIVIDEVHEFYNTEGATEALGDLDTICRTGRSMEIGVAFSSQNPNDIPRGLGSVINTKIFFKSDTNTAKKFGIKIADEEMDALKKGYACCSIYDMAQLKIIKFPLSFAGVFEGE